jgi:hypothetical protein
MPVSTFLGMTPTSDFDSNERPQTWREGYMRLYPNGAAVLTALLSMTTPEVTSDPVYHWFEKDLPKAFGDVTDVFTDPLLGSAYASGAVAGTTLYFQVAEAVAEKFRIGHWAMAQSLSVGSTSFRRGKVTSVILNGASSYIAVLMQETDTANALAGTDLVIEVIGNSNPEGAEMPIAISHKGAEFNNQIFRTPLQITRTARKTRLRTVNAYLEKKRDALEDHALEMDWAFMFGIKTLTTGPNGNPDRTTKGIITAMLESGSGATTGNYALDAAFTGDTWLESGEDWFDAKLAEVFRYGDDEKLALIGYKALNGLTKLAKNGGHINITPFETAWGLKTLMWITNFGVLHLRTHPIMAERPQYNNSLAIIEPRRLKYRHIEDSDTHFISDPEDQINRNNSRDGTEEEWLTESGLEHHQLKTMAYLEGVGVDNALT